jgi:sugar lactone lactonase YvrE
MKKQCVLLLTLVAFASTVSAQITTDGRHESIQFGAPPVGQAVWHLPRSVAVDGQGLVVVFRASDPPVLYFNRAGELQQTWGTGMFPDAHSVDIDHEGFLWFTDRDSHMVYKYTIEGEQVMALGTKGVAGDNTSRTSFNRPSDVAVAQNGDVFVADGYTNSRIMHFSPEGQLIEIIGGTKGSEPGQFDLLHAIAIDSRGNILVLDRQTATGRARVQILDQTGTFLEEWTDIGGNRPAGLVIDSEDTVYISDTDQGAITVLKDGRILDVIGGLNGRPHNLARDPETGVFYFADPVTLFGAETSDPAGQIKQVVPR